MKKLFNKIKNKVVSMVKNVARKILKNEIVADHEIVGAREVLARVLADKKATKAMMTEAMQKALVHIDEALGK